MNTGTVAVLGVLLVTLIPPGHGGETEADRSADYIGFGYVNHGLNEEWVPACESVFGAGDCPLRIPSGVTSTSCDTETGNGGGMHQGFGGVRFCAIRSMSTLHLRVVDQEVEPRFRVTCWIADWHYSSPNWYLDTFRGEGIVTLPNLCAQHSADPPGTTRVGIWIHGPPDGPYATQGTAYLTFLEAA